ncbi:MAG: non-canonical purine NTP pyrophosphatase [bacterium]|nr:non-canonical purine NTP pyrophosphatase [bacterium]
MANVVFITGNQGKADYLASYLGYPVDHVKLDLDEIQSLDLHEIVRYKVRQAYEKVQKPVLVEDVSLEFFALGKLPGTFIRWFVDELSLEGLCSLLDGKDRSAAARCVFGYFDGEKEMYFEGGTQGRISEKPAGTGGYGWDQIYIPNGYTETRAQLNEEDYRITYGAIKPLQQVADFLRSI